jgi:hypothetical protein
VICSKFQPKTILEYSAAEQMSEADQALVPQALMMLQDSPLRNFRIQVDADSLVQLDEQQNKKDRVEFLSAFGGFLKEALPVGQQSPDLVPMLVQLMKFGVGGFKQAKPIEGTLDVALEQLKQKAVASQQNPQQRPDPEMMKLQAQQQLEQAKMQASAQGEQMRVQADAQAAQIKAQLDSQIHQSKLQADMQLAQMQAQIEDQKMQHEMAMKSQELASKEQFERWKAELDAATKIMVAQIGAKASLDQAAQSAEQAAASEMQATGTQNAEAAQMVDMHGQTLAALRGVMETLAKPKTIIRGLDGRVAGLQ